MRYYVLYDDNGKVIRIGTGEDGDEISEVEYNALLVEILEKAELSDKLYYGEIAIDDIPEKWREEIEQEVNDRIAAEGTADEQELSAEEALNIILGGVDR